MKSISLQWRLTLITTLLIAIICATITLYVYSNGVYYIDSLQEAVNSQSESGGSDENNSDNILITIPEDNWAEFASDFSIRVFNNKLDYKKQSFIFSTFAAVLGGILTYFISGRALKPLNNFTDQIEKVTAQNLSNSKLEENNIKELNRLSVAYNQMLSRINEAFEIQKQFTANAAHELKTPLAVLQLQLDLYNSENHSGTDNQTLETIKKMGEQCEQLSKTVKTLLDMSELQTVAQDEVIELDALIEEVTADLDPLAQEKNITLNNDCEPVSMTGSDILIYRLVYNLTENAIKYNHSGGNVTVSTKKRNDKISITVADDGNGIPDDMKERIFEPFFRVDKSRSRALGGVGLGLSLVKEIVRVHGGSISVKDNKGGGTIFEVSFTK